MPEAADADSPQTSSEINEDELIEEFGTLSIGEGKSMRFFGVSAVEVSYII